MPLSHEYNSVEGYRAVFPRVPRRKSKEHVSNKPTHKNKQIDQPADQPKQPTNLKMGKRRAEIEVLRLEEKMRDEKKERK